MIEIQGEENVAFCQQDDSSVGNAVLSSILTSFRGLRLSISVSEVKLPRETRHIVTKPSWSRDLGFCEGSFEINQEIELLFHQRE